VAFESPHRLLESLREIREIFGEGALVSIGREMTKKHEEFVRGEVSEVIDQLRH